MYFTRLEFLLLIPPILGLLLWRAYRRGRFLGHPLMFYLQERIRHASGWVRLPAAFQYVALAFLLVALLNPVLRFAEHEISVQALDIILALDLSASMQQPLGYHPSSGSFPKGPEEYAGKPNRLDAVKKAAIDFIEKRPNDRIGLVVFSANAYVVNPLTVDHQGLIQYVQMLDGKTLIGEGLTSVGEGLFAAHNLMVRQNRLSRGRKQKGKVIVVFTDAEQNYGRKPFEPIAEARQFGTRLYMIGVDVKTEVAEGIIDAIRASGGKYYDASDARQLREAYLEINSLEKNQVLSKEYIRNEPSYFLFASVAVILLSASVLLRAVPYFTEIS
ncbi:MAG: VWA domain-containing protein [Acidobacteria bacterium]|nr:VWA domain-containing protein [Acidobacteriota bacterium]